MKVIIIGKNSFIATNLKIYLKKKKVFYKTISFSDFLLKKNTFKNFDCIINCSSNKNFIEKKYLFKNDHDTRIARTINKTELKLIILSTRKVYKTKYNSKETDKILPKCNYSKNKSISEKKSFKILGKRLLILRISNLIGKPKKNYRKLHNTFLDIFFSFAKKGVIFDNKKIFKDFLSVNKLNEIILKLIKNKAYGIYNVSLGKKVYLNDIIKWLNFYNNKKIRRTLVNNSFNQDNFTLNNEKLRNKIKIRINISELRDECKKLSKKEFVK